DRTVIRIAFWAAALPGVLAAVDRAGAAAGLDPAVGGSAAAGVLHAVLGPGQRGGADRAFAGARHPGPVGAGARAGPDAGAERPVRSRAPDGARPVRRGNLMAGGI